MHNTRELLPGIHWVGGNDRRLDRFENLFPLTNGVAYNAYVILDERTALIDTVDNAISELFMENVKQVLGGRPLDYLVINHMEPDHCGNIVNIIREFPNVTLIGNTKTFQFFEQFYGVDIQGKTLLVKDQDRLSLGQRTLKFYSAAMVHWPEVMMTYDEDDKILFSADAFGTFGAHSGGLFADETDYLNDYLAETRRYFANIIGKFGPQVQALMKKLSQDEIDIIAPLHGPVYRKDDLGYIVNKYELWSTYRPEVNSVLIVYATMYNNTTFAAEVLASQLAQRGIKGIKLMDVNQLDVSYLIAEVWKYAHVVIATPTYNADIAVKMHTFLHDLVALNVQNRSVSLITNLTWAGKPAEIVWGYLEKLKNITLVGETVTLKSTVKPDNEAPLIALAEAIVSHLSRT